jgi:hypothetical protein
MSLLGRVVGSLYHGVKTIGKYVNPVAKFIGKYHQPITQLGHALAMASGHEGLQRVTGAMLAFSNMAAMRQNLNQDNAKIAAATAANGGRSGVFNHSTGTFNR